MMDCVPLPFLHPSADHPLPANYRASAVCHFQWAADDNSPISIGLHLARFSSADSGGSSAIRTAPCRPRRALSKRHTHLARFSPERELIISTMRAQAGSHWRQRCARNLDDSAEKGDLAARRLAALLAPYYGRPNDSSFMTSSAGGGT